MIYFLRCGPDGPIKIGFTDGDIALRVVFLQCGCPWELVPMGTMDGDMARETELHRVFSHLSMRGEWFHPTSELIDFIAKNSVESGYRSGGRRVVSDPTNLDAVKTALGGNVGIARALGSSLTPQAVSQWRDIPVIRAIELEKKAGISRHVSRPDIFGPEPARATA